MSNPPARGRPPYSDVLTPAEWRVAEGVRHGLSNRVIADRQGVSLDAVKFHVANIFGKLGLTRRAELRRWSGVRKDSNLAKTNDMTTTIEHDVALGPIGQIARSVADIAAAQTWYGEVLGLKHLYTFGTLAFFDCGGTRLMLAQGEGKAESILYFRVADVHPVYERLRERGVEFVSAPHLIHRHDDGTEEWMAFFNDPEGRLLALMAQVAGPSSD